MMWTQRKVWACGLAALGLAVGGGAVASQLAQAQSPPIEPGVKPVALRPEGNKPVPPKDGREAEVEALKKEIEALRKKVEALGKKEEPPNQENRWIVVTRPLAKDVDVAQQYVGKILAHRHINVCAGASGFLTEVMVKEGQAVKKDQEMFRISPTLYKAKLDVELAEVNIAQLEFNGVNRLHNEKVVSQTEVALARAKLARAQAKAKFAEAELSLTAVRAPFDGLVGRLQMHQGSLIKEGDTLTTLSDNSIMWVYFKVPEARYLEYMAKSGQDPAGRQIELVLANGSKLPQTGVLGAIEADFENETGNIPFRADFPNPDRLLRHGQTGNVLIHRTVSNAIVIPQRATFEILNKRYVYIVDKDNVVHRREIAIQHEMDGIFVVKKGLDVNDKIVLEGVRQVHDGGKVEEYESRRPEEVLAGPRTHVKE
jgi:membrane fusion protein (multidrug efflux system)